LENPRFQQGLGDILLISPGEHEIISVPDSVRICHSQNPATPFVLSVSKGEPRSCFDRLSTNGDCDA